MNEVLSKIDVVLFIIAGFFALGYLAQTMFVAGCMASGKVTSGRLSGTNAYLALAFALAGVFFL
jgi:hypothetical protein